MGMHISLQRFYGFPVLLSSRLSCLLQGKARTSEAFSITPYIILFIVRRPSAARTAAVAHPVDGRHTRRAAAAIHGYDSRHTEKTEQKDNINEEECREHTGNYAAGEQRNGRMTAELSSLNNSR